MKNIYILFTIVLIFTSCNRNDDINNDNPNLIDPLVSINLNLDLPEYNGLNFPNNSVVLTQVGVRGIVVFNVNNDLYTAFDLADPNHTLSSCSTMEIDGILATCSCEDDDNVYDLVTGQHQTRPDTFPMQAYRAERIGNSIRISN